jgi:hypothetical protein
MLARTGGIAVVAASKTMRGRCIDCFRARMTDTVVFIDERKASVCVLRITDRRYRLKSWARHGGNFQYMFYVA